MNEQITVLTLKCLQCGASLEIKNSVSQFACGYCGANQIVERSGGAVSLSLITDAIYQVRAGTDKTAAELAIVRLQNELHQLEYHHAYQAKLDDNSIELRRKQATGNIALGVIFSFLAWVFISLAVQNILITILLLCVSGIIIYLVRSKSIASMDRDTKNMEQQKKINLQPIEYHIQELNQKLAHQKQIANS
jgi:predicted RNA-binding Zn-ribbon protein involved in translation (DUF1610 family)